MSSCGIDLVGGNALSSMNLAGIFVGLANRWPDGPATISAKLNLSFSQLLARAAQSARELRVRGIAPETNVGICVRDSAESVVLTIAIWMLGATAVVLDFRSNAAEKAMLVAEFELVAILEDRQADAVDYHSVLVDRAWSDVIGRHARDPVWTNGKKTAPALISLTSGTTGRPTGIVLDHERVFLQAVFDLSQGFGTCLLNPLPLWFSGSRNHTYGALLKGAAVRFHPLLFSTQKLAAAIQAPGVTSVCLVPTIVRELLRLSGERSSPLFDKLNALYCFGAPMRPEEKLHTKRALCRNFVMGYGANICGRISSISGPDLEARPETMGRVLPHVALQIVGAHDEILPAGETGAIRVRSPAMSLNFYGESGRTSNQVKDGWAYPGDLGVVDESGYLCLLGRTSELIIRGGVNVYPSEVEGVIAAHDGVRDVAVVGFEKQREGEEIAAFVVAEGDLSEETLIAYCRTQLSADKRPRKFVFVAELPRTAKGSVSRGKLRQQLETSF